MDELRITPEGFRLGVTSLPIQAEGGDKRNSWHDWYKKGYIKDGTDPAVCGRFFEDYREFIDLMAEMGIRDLRLGLEWSRLEPARGVFNNGVIKHYREMLGYIVSKGIRPMLTLHSYSDPQWFMDLGGFESPECEKIFLHYVKMAAESFGDLVSEFITFDEPNTYALNGYFYGCFPPGKQSYKLYRSVLTTLASCHMAAYGLIHSILDEGRDEQVKVSVSIGCRYYEPKDPKSGYQKRAVKWLDDFSYLSFARAVMTGKASKPVRKLGKSAGCYVDFIAMNYITGGKTTGLDERPIEEGIPVSDTGTAICPKGLALCAEKLSSLRSLPVYVTGCGVCDNEDFFRLRFIYEHLQAAMGSSADIRGFYYRSFADGFELLEGSTARYGLVKTEGEEALSVRRSGEFYSDIIRAGGITEEIALRYTGTYYHDINGKILEGLDDVYYDRQKVLKSEIGEGIITEVSRFSADPEGYDEAAVREENGTAVNREFPPAPEPAETVTSEAEPSEPETISVPEEKGACDITEALDFILGRTASAPSEDLPLPEGIEEIVEKDPVEHLDEILGRI